MTEIIAAIRVHLNAIDGLLKLLDRQMLSPEEPVCPNCGAEIVQRSRTMGSTGREHVCTQCDWQGETA